MNNNAEVQYFPDEDCYLFSCPHCNAPVQVRRPEVNCRIFRHGQMKNTYDLRFGDEIVDRVPIANILYAGAFLNPGDRLQARRDNDAPFEHASVVAVNEGQQVNPHASQDHCDRLVEQGLIWGCGKPFKLLRNDNNYNMRVAKCAYI